MSRVARAIGLAFAMLTILPVPVFGDDDEDDLGPEPTEADLADSRYAYPLVGLVIGLVLAGLNAGLGAIGAPPLVAAFVLLAAGVAITGGLHLDGLADTGDGLFLGGDVERRLAVMRDPHLGSFGATALALTLLGQFAAIASLEGQVRSLALIVAGTLGRSAILVAAGVARYARPEGLGRVVVESTTRQDALVTAILTVMFGTLLAGGPGLAGSLVGLGLDWGFGQLATRRLGGLTGDVLGALVELEQLAVLVTLSLAQPLWAK